MLPVADGGVAGSFLALPSALPFDDTEQQWLIPTVNWSTNLTYQEISDWQ
jgi:hypothetical protein